MTIAVFLGKRLLGMAALLLILSLLVYSLLTISPGSPIQALIGPRQATPELVSALTAKYHLDDPFPAQYWNWLTSVVQLDFGRSISVETDSDVLGLITGRIGLSAGLAGYALLIVVAFGIPLGLLAGIRRGRAEDRTVSLFATVGISAPSFVMAIVLLYVFGVALGWFPVYGVGSGFADRVAHLTLPALTIAIFLSAIVIRQTRAASLTVMTQDYVTFARVRGLSRGRIMLRYALRNSSLPVVTSVGILLISAVSSALFAEQVFSVPGVGSLLLQAVTNKDVPVVQGLVMLLGLLVVIVNLVVDLLALVLDPRTRSASRGGV
ncbi:ABC transporter permease [Amycolatopsis jejuensis]|uniref:ABC transporter permease n=1 Tax=Amycolatopsis jejuensis TaxID=330084 RepID=UPI000A02F6D9|nr:ABC transporter permease [Amycolatopsis jejuensis]